MDESIGTKIKECRIKKGLTQKQLGDLIGVSPVMISQYETGIRKPKAETINKLSLALDSKELLMYNYIIHTNITYDQKLYDSLYNEFYNKFFNGLSGLSPDGASYEQTILKSFRKLNKTGKQEAIKRVDELTELPKYTTPDQPEQQPEQDPDGADQE